jgi:hypothetical protein
MGVFLFQMTQEFAKKFLCTRRELALDNLGEISLDHVYPVSRFLIVYGFPPI